MSNVITKTTTIINTKNFEKGGFYLVGFPTGAKTYARLLKVSEKEVVFLNTLTAETVHVNAEDMQYFTFNRRYLVEKDTNVGENKKSCSCGKQICTCGKDTVGTQKQDQKDTKASAKSQKVTPDKKKDVDKASKVSEGTLQKLNLFGADKEDLKKATQQLREKMENSLRAVGIDPSQVDIRASVVPVNLGDFIKEATSRK